MIAYDFCVRNTETGEMRIWEVRPRRGLVSIRRNITGEKRETTGFELAPSAAAKLVPTLKTTSALLSVEDEGAEHLEYFTGGFHMDGEGGICNVHGANGKITISCPQAGGIGSLEMTLSEARRLAEIMPLAIPEAEHQLALAEAEAKSKKNPEI